MKKWFLIFSFIICLSAVPAMQVKADENNLRPLSTWINNYGLDGQRIIFITTWDMLRGVAQSNRPVVVIKANNRFIALTNDADAKMFWGDANAWPNNTGYWESFGSLSSLNFQNYYPDLAGVDLSSVFEIDGNIYYSISGSFDSGLSVQNCDVTWTNLQDFIDEQEENGWTNPNNPNNPDPNNLPMMRFGLTRNTVMGFPKITKVKETLTWNYTEHDIYKNNPTDFYVEIIASARFKPYGVGEIRDTADNSINDNCKVSVTNGGCNISMNSYSFMYDDIGKSLYATASKQWGDGNGGYFIYVRTVQKSTDKKSAWKVYNFALGGYCDQESTIYEPDGTPKNLPQNQNDIGDGTGLQPAKYTTDGSTDAQADPSSVNYDGGTENYNPGTVIASLRATINTIKEIPQMLQAMLPMIPDWLITLIEVSIGLMVIIGVVKLIVH